MVGARVGGGGAGGGGGGGYNFKNVFTTGILSWQSTWCKVKIIGTAYVRKVVVNYNEPPRVKTNKMACAPSEDSDQPGHSPSLIRVFTARLKKAMILSYPLSASEDSDQTGRMPRLIWVFAGRTATLLVLSRGGSNIDEERSLRRCFSSYGSVMLLRETGVFTVVSANVSVYKLLHW